MKKKKQNRQLKRMELNRETLVQLSSEEVKQAEGQVGECTGCPSGCGIFPTFDPA